MKHGNIQMTVAVPVPGKVKKDILSKAQRLLDRHRHAFGTILLHIYVKNANSRVGCSLNLFTDDGRYHSYIEDWDVRRAVDDATSAIHQQVVKHFEKREEASRDMVHV